MRMARLAKGRSMSFSVSRRSGSGFGRERIEGWTEFVWISGCGQRDFSRRERWRLGRASWDA